MQIHFRAPHQWFDLSEFAAQELRLKEKFGAVRPYGGLALALTDTLLGLTRQFPHKKKVLCFQSIPIFQSAMMMLSRDGYNVNTFGLSHAKDAEFWKSHLDPQTLFVAVSEDDPFLGKLFNWSELERLTAEKKIYLIKVSHHHHRYSPLPDKYERTILRFNAISPTLTLVLLSERLKLVSTLGEDQIFPEDTKNLIRKYKPRGFISPKLIEDFESKKPAGSLAVFSKEDDQRIFDRAVIYWPNLDGWAVVQRLAQRLQIALPEAGGPTLLETTSLNRWKTHGRAMEWLSAMGLNEAMIRGTVIIDPDLINSQFVSHLQSVTQEIKDIQQLPEEIK
ncbi:MAG: hypothetical protein K1X29_01595 [Bdellovibrionales bacterium]|nr:hypothetical protein [Bdellovibrionales bacterium]